MYKLNKHLLDSIYPTGERAVEMLKAPHYLNIDVKDEYCSREFLHKHIIEVKFRASFLYKNNTDFELDVVKEKMAKSLLYEIHSDVLRDLNRLYAKTMSNAQYETAKEIYEIMDRITKTLL